MNDKTPDEASTRHIPPPRRDDLDFHELDGEAVLYDARCGAVHRFNAVTLSIWNACDGHHALADIAHLLSEEYSVATDRALVHVERAIERFEARELLQGERAGTAVTSIGDDEASASPKIAAQSRGLSRRQVLRSTTGKAVLAAPLISTFFASGAYASMPASGPGGCKLIGFSCTAKQECCVGTPNGDCLNSKCCIKTGKQGCEFDSDCCNYPTDMCMDGVCQ